MKTLLVLFIVYLNYVTCESNKYAVKNFPKKVKPYGNGKILINSGKYELRDIKAKGFPKGTTKTSKRSYTVFQVVGNSKTIQGVPDSPYFPVDQSYDHKPRVKKVLPDYAWSSLRNKRSAVLDTPLGEQGTNTPKPIEPIIEKKIDSTTLQPQPAKKQEVANVVRKSSHNQDENNSKKNENDETKPIQRTGPEITKKKDVPKTTKKIDTKTTKKVEPKPASKDDPKTAKSKPVAKVDDKPKNKEAAKGPMRTVNNKTQTATDVKAKPKAVVVRGKKNGTARVQPRGGRKKKIKNQKRTGKGKPLKRPVKGRKGRVRKSKIRARSKKVTKPKPVNRSRTAKAPKANRRLIAAREALIEDYPYVVSIQKDEQHWCSGALLNPRLVITTANCLWKASRLSRMEVRAGSRHIDRGGQMAGIQEVMKHPAWGLRKNPDNDVALMLLDRNIRFSDSCHGVDLPNRVMMPPFDDAWVTSWGAERRDGVFDTDATALQVYHTRLMDREKCNNITIRFSVAVTENFICLAQHGRAAPCTRDTGAPAVSDGVLWGLASWGIRKLCGTERFPAMFSYLASHSNVDFVTNATSYLMADQRHYPFGDRFPMPRNPPRAMGDPDVEEPGDGSGDRP